jgi:triosephosphate isomerase (TIM)
MEKILIFNWKMNPSTLREAVSLAKASDFDDVVVAPPFTFLEKVGNLLKKSELGAQDLFWEDKGAFTGEVSAKELKSVGVKYVIIGHSERRHKFDETDEMVAKKMKAAAENGLISVLCVGETALRIGLSQLSNVKGKSLIVAYEPVWAIGTGNPESPESALETIRYIKSMVSGKWSFTPKVLYGGSVNSKNLKNYLQYKEVDGALVGGASLKKDEIKKVVKI